MGEIFVHMLPYAIGIAVSPVPVITVILMLFSTRPIVNGSSFLLGWAIGIAIPAAVILMFAIRDHGEEPSPPSYAGSVLRVVLGLALLIFAIWQWSQRHKPSSKPLLMKLVDSISSWKAWLVGFLFADVTNPKNMALTVGGCVEISASSTFSEMAFLVSLFVIIASAGVAVPVILYLLGGESSRNIMETWKHWLVLHKKGVMAILFMVFGLSLVVKGSAGLLN